MARTELIDIQIHDYDKYGNYRIIEDRKATLEEIYELKEKARKSVNVDWEILPLQVRHIVYYAELLLNGDVWFVGFYMKGEAFEEKEFERIFQAENIGFVGAFHRHD
jgi:hypothetical protein